MKRDRAGKGEARERPKRRNAFGPVTSTSKSNSTPRASTIERNRRSASSGLPVNDPRRLRGQPAPDRAAPRVRCRPTRNGDEDAPGGSDAITYSADARPIVAEELQQRQDGDVEDSACSMPA